MKRIGLILIQMALVLAPLAAKAQIRLPSFQDLCAYESDCSKAGRVVKGQFVVKQPRPQLMAFYKPLRALIVQIANQYHIDPVTLVLTPIAENTMNVNIVDKIEDELEEQGKLDDDGRIIASDLETTAMAALYNKPLSIGPGQIYVYAAKNVEPLAASIEQRPMRVKKDIKRQLMTREGALRYAAAIIRNAQDIYAAGGYDISRRPEILATLYNIGRVKERLSNARGRQPLPNYFGFFVGQNYWSVRQALNLPSILDTPAAH